MSLVEKIKRAFFENAYIRAFGITLLAFLLSIIIAVPFSPSTSAIFSTPESGGDFNMSDLFAQFADRRPVRDLDNDVVIVDIGLSDRLDIAELLSELSTHNPAAIGLDINFGEPRDEDIDAFLKEVIENTPRLVLPLGVKETDNGFEIEDKPFFYEELSSQVYGVVNLPSHGSKSPIREFPVSFNLERGDTLKSFAVTIAGMVRPESLRSLEERGNRNEIIDYVSREFKIIPSGEVTERGDEFTDKIVLVGALNEAGDMHSTPINSYMSGIKVHAYALGTILHKGWYRSIPLWVDYCVAFVICYMIVLAAVALTNRIKGLLIRLTQVLLVYIAVWVGYILYVDRHVVISFSHTLIMIAFGLFAIDIWNGFEAIGLYCVSGYKKIKNRNNIR